MGAQLAKEVATKTQDIAGDGTTTATVCSSDLVNEGLRLVAAGAAPGEVKKGVEAAVEVLQERLAENAIEVSGDMVSHVAAISSDEPEIGELLAKAFDTVGVNGVITVEESSTTDTELEITEGMEFDKGYLSPYMRSEEHTSELQSRGHLVCRL